MPQSFSATDVMMGRPKGGGSSPYLWSGPGAAPPGPAQQSKKPVPGVSLASPVSPGPMPVGKDMATTTMPASTSGTLGPESIRATGTGPFDAAYRQNLATYAGGQFSRPGGMSFNPTDPNTFPGNPTGGGTAPVTGMPSTLLDTALSGQGFSWTPPQPAQTGQNPGDFMGLQQWMDQFMRNGRGGRMGALA